jgi:hypothetical protein
VVATVAVALGLLAPVPPANEHLPRSPAPLASRLAEVSDVLRDSIDGWRADGIGTRPPREVQLGALYQQRAYRLLAKRPRLAAATLRRLPGSLRPTARDSIRAIRNLLRLAGPPRNRRFRTGRALPAGVLLRHYRAAERRFGVGWRVLAAVNLVETDFNRLRNNSSSGAQGPMQFMPATWRAYGMGGDVRDPHDAIVGAANYLHANGAPADNAGALYHYNPSSLYVRAVLAYKRQMRNSAMFRFYYARSLFVRSKGGGHVRLTGP